MPAIGVMPMPALANTTGRRVVEDDVPEGQRHGQPVADLHRVAEQVGHLAVGLVAAADPLDRELAVLAVVGPGEAVLPRLADAVGHRHLHGHVLAGQRGLHQAVVGPAHPERHDVLGLLDPLGDLPLAPHRLRAHAAGAVEAALLVDQRVRHQPVDLVPGGGHLGRDGVAEHVDDRPEQVVVDDVVLGRGDAERRVLVRDAGEQVLGQLLGHLHQRAGEDRHRAGQGHLLALLGLVAAVEGAVEQFGVLAEQVLVEACRDLLDVLRDDREGRLDHGTGSVGKHVFSLASRWCPRWPAVTFRLFERYPFFRI